MHIPNVNHSVQLPSYHSITGGGRSLKVGGQEWASGAVPPVKYSGKAPGAGMGLSSPEADDFFVKISYFIAVLRMTCDICIHCLQVFNTKWKKNQFGGTKVIGQATMHANSAQKVGMPTLPNRLCRQCFLCNSSYSRVS